MDRGALGLRAALPIAAPGADSDNHAMNDFQLRPIAAADDAAVAHVIRTVMPEFGACGPGFAINDPEVDWMSRAYAGPRAAYFVIERDGRVLGGGGIAPLAGGDDGTCELRKMYFLPGARGHGLGERLLRHCLDAARALGYRACYLETLGGMDAAVALYEKLGFVRLERPLGETGHYSCDRYYRLEL
jgi:putative acetyltransferase